MPLKTTLLRNQNALAVLLVIFCCACATVAALLGVIINVVLLGIIAAVCIFYLTYTMPQYSMVIMMAGVFLLPLAIKVFYLGDVPVGTLIEGINGLLIFTLLIKGRLSGFKTLPGILILAWLLFNIIELANPHATSRIAGIFAFRTVLSSVMAFFVAYAAIESKKDLYVFFKWWFIFGLMAALYGLYQEFIGLPQHDLDWASYDENRYNLLFTWGRMRKFSFFNGPTEFGLVMAYTAVAGLVISFVKQLTPMQRIGVLTASAVMLWAMVFSGSRTASILIPMGVVLFAAITLQRQALMVTAAIGFGGVALLLRPTTSASLFIMLTAFEFSSDASMNVRIQNQSIIRDYIQQTPLGFGLGSTGDLGAKYSPDSFIGKFPPDSELVKIAIETGWVGLFIWCVILATILGFGIHTYFLLKDPELKALLLIPLISFFMMAFAQYPQECFRAPVLGLLFSFMAGLITKINQLGKSGMKALFLNQSSNR